MKKILYIFALLLFSRLILGAVEKEKILCSTFPIYQFTKNITKDIDYFEVELLLPPQLGCPHDYVLTPKDISTLSKAKIFIINGLGLEDFIIQKIRNLNREIIIIDSSKGIEDIIYQHCCHHHHKDAEGSDREEVSKHKLHHNHHDTPNPHLFASPRRAAKIVMSIAEQLSLRYSSYREKFLKNANEYAERLNKLADQMKESCKRLPNKRIVQPHGVFDYLAEDIGLEIIATLQPHGHEPSAAEMAKIVRLIQEKGAIAIIIEPQYPDKVAKTLSSQTNVPVLLLDPVASGPENAPLDYYERTMLANLKNIESLIK